MSATDDDASPSRESAAKTYAACLQSGRVEECRVATEAALRLDPQDHLALAYRGIATGLLESAEAGIADLAAAAEAAEANGQPDVAAFAFHYLGNALDGTKRHEEALRALERAAKLGRRDSGLFTALCQVAVTLGREPVARDWGERALLAKDAEVGCPLSDEVPRMRPRAFDPIARARNVIGYSLFGKDRFYQECAVTTARHLPFVYPEFTARFYCSPDIPGQVLGALRAAQAEVRVSRTPDPPMSAALMWRFLPFDDPEVDIVLVRDVDSPITPRERAGLDLWLRSDAPFNVMRDHVQHTAPILAGLWGGFTGLLPPLAPLARRFHRSDVSRYADQNFLRLVVWPRIRKATLAIDSVYRLGDTVDYPAGFEKSGTIHVGCSWTRPFILGRQGGQSG